MKNLIPYSLAFLSLLPSSQAEGPKGQVACTATYRTLDGKDNTVERFADIPVKVVLGEQVKHIVDFQGRTFTVTEERGDLFAQIIAPTDLPRGVTSRGTLDGKGQFHLAQVEGVTVYRIECNRN